MGPPGVHRGLPSTSLTLVLPVDEPIDVSWAEGSSRARRWSVVSGLHAAPAAIRHDGHQSGVQLALTPAGARALLGMPAAALGAALLQLDELDPPGATDRQLRHLPEQLHDTADWSDRLRLVQDALVGAMAQRPAARPRSEVAQALSRLASGQSVAAVAAEVGWSRRHLTTQVSAELGLSPKVYQRVARFQTAHQLLLTLARAGRPSLAEVAADTGYADQAHLTREWVELAGCSPARWLREEFPYVQDSPVAGDDDGADGADHPRRAPKTEGH
ncbi:AraC family transcriptional regulator [Ornithinimicrobium pratense]|uniref:AraC family transcriptional regulator n=2 Tax=Ornithinimicrobium pratense TaxID=2593973 RepID=A0A5J6VAU5_9MICO|nr:AraC family transcriptional regulator [Ornithinimicrobium pratense]